MPPPAKVNPPPPSKLKRAAGDALAFAVRLIASIGIVGLFVFLRVRSVAYALGWPAVALGALGIGLFAWKRKGRDFVGALLGLGGGITSLAMRSPIVGLAGAALALVALNLWVADLFAKREA